LQLDEQMKSDDRQELREILSNFLA
jgi:hypothetical protein